MARIVGEVQPTYVWVENSPMLLVRGIDRVLWDLAALGYDARWGVVSAADAGAPHVRERCWILAHAMQARSQERMEYEGADSLTGCSLQQGSKWQEADSDVLRVADGVANRVDRISAIGNGQVPAVVRLAWETLMGQSMHNGDREIK
jgi:DNA (cytosine-5)-methyltransferase 1